MIHIYNEKDMIKKENGEIQYYKQIAPFTNGKIYENKIAMKIYGNCLIFFSKETKLCLGIADKKAMDLFEKV